MFLAQIFLPEIVIGKDILKQGYNKGRGSFKIRGEIDLEEKVTQKNAWS